MILIGIITSEVKNYCWKEFSKALKGFNFPILFVDNSKGQKNRYFIQKEGFECLYVNPNGRDIKQTMALSHDLLRQEAIKRNCDLFHLESDIILSQLDIEALDAHQLEVVGYPYFVGFGAETKLMVQKIEEFGSQRDVIYPDVMPSGGIEKVFHCGLGAILIRNHILKQFKFRFNKEADSLHPDSVFAYDLFRKNIPIYCDTSKVVRHLNKKYWV